MDSRVLQHFYASLLMFPGFPKAPCPVLLCGYCFRVSLSAVAGGAEVKALAGRGLWRQGMQSGLGQPKLPRRGRQGHPGLGRLQRGGGDRGMKTETESMGSADKAGPAQLGRAGQGRALGLRTVQAPPWDSSLRWGFGWGAPTPK